MLCLQMSLKYVYLGIGAAVASYAEVTCWVITGERQAARIRSKYLKAILRQDVTFFDKETSTGEMVGRMAGDTVLIQDAIGEKVCIPNFFSFFCSSSPIGNSRIYYESDV
jgi:ATP-binding cassette subfamily B (MDR/TAP) protein 1